jgi:diphthamide synthase (EF-2-diphthine--ammonia ligase)
MASRYPVWGRDTSKLIKDFILLGFKAAIVCVDPAKLDASFVGRVIDEDLLTQLPLLVDPCGEMASSIHLFLMGQFLKTL